jgi:hypothetical protein
MGVRKNRAAAALDENSKAYRTSDNSRYIVKRDQDISELIQHCIEAGLILTDEQTGQEVELKVKKRK